MELAAFTEVFERVKSAHVAACEDSLREDPEWELAMPIFYVVLDIDGGYEITPVSELSVKAESGDLGNAARRFLKTLDAMSPEARRRLVRHKVTGARPNRVDAVAAGFASEGWERKAECSERGDEVSMVVLEDREYHVGNAVWTKDVKNAALRARDSNIRTSRHDIDTNMGNLFELEPRGEHAH